MKKLIEKINPRKAATIKEIIEEIEEVKEEIVEVKKDPALLRNYNKKKK
jgi:hypothetical protein